MGYYDIRQIPPFLAGPSIIASISQDYRHYPHHYDKTTWWVILEGLEFYEDTQMKAFNITKLTLNCKVAMYSTEIL